MDLYPNVAQEYEISLSPMKLDLPALIFLKNGRESGKLPKRNDSDNVQLDQIKNQKLKSVKVTWDRLGWDRSMVCIVTSLYKNISKICDTKLTLILICLIIGFYY